MGRSTTTATEAESRTDIYQRATDRIVAAIEAGLAEGKAGMPWHRKGHGGTATGLPMNAASKTSYRGVNVPVLWATADAAGYSTRLWATYRQWLCCKVWLNSQRRRLVRVGLLGRFDLEPGVEKLNRLGHGRGA